MSSKQKLSRRDKDNNFENIRLKQDQDLPPGYFPILKQVNKVVRILYEKITSYNGVLMIHRIEIEN